MYVFVVLMVVVGLLVVVVDGGVFESVIVDIEYV